MLTRSKDTRAVLVVALLSTHCHRPVAEEPLDAGPPAAAPWITLVTFDALAEGSSATYPPRVAARLRASTATPRDAAVLLDGGLTLRVAWETRDDEVFGRRYLTAARVTVDHIEPGARCWVSGTSVKPPESRASDESITLSVNTPYACEEGPKHVSGAASLGTISVDGLTGVLGPSARVTGSSPPLEPPAIAAIHFGPRLATLDDKASAVLDRYARALKADESIVMCIAFYGGPKKASAALSLKRQEAVRKALAARGVPETRVPEFVDSGQSPPAVDDLELWPREPTCSAPTAKERR